MKIFALCTFVFGISQVCFNIAFGNYFEIIKQIIMCKELMRDLIISFIFILSYEFLLFAVLLFNNFCKKSCIKGIEFKK